MAKKANEKPDPTNSTEPTPNSSPLDEAQANPNAATGDSTDQTNEDVQESQPVSPEDTNPGANPPTEHELTQNDPTALVPAGSADATADSTADGQHNGTENTLPQSPIHEGELSEDDKDAIIEESNQPGAVLARIAEKYNITSERVQQIVDDANLSRIED